ncbi:MAG: carboxypeptidase M32 [Eubacteriales bacterium]|nr:carboxypeptidase M32 [Eubacteriales bacterium]
MEKLYADKLQFVLKELDRAEDFSQMSHILNFDMETIAPEKGMEKQSELVAFLNNEEFRIRNSEEFISAAEYLYNNINELTIKDADTVDILEKTYDRELLIEMIKVLHRHYLKDKNISPKMNHEMSLAFNKAYLDWLKAKQNADYSLFAPQLEIISKMQNEAIMLREDRYSNLYDNYLSDYDRGMLQEDIDKAFESCKNRLLPLLNRIKESKKKIRTDFMFREVSDDAQMKMAKYLLNVLGFDFERGTIATTEHPFSDTMGRDDVRVTTHFYKNNFASSIYSVIHECGHALFDQLQPESNFDHHIYTEKTMGMHESVSRFYENRIGRSREFIHLIYPEAKKIFSDILNDVTEEELYEAVNVVEPSLIRIEADEFTYTFHIIIRYEIEKLIVNGKIDINEYPSVWNRMYKELLGIEPQNDAEGILQDVHWTSGFGYFPSYALGNMYNSMYYKTMNQDLPVSEAVLNGDFKTINNWMREHVFAKADRLSSKEWIKDITGREFTAEDFLDYLEEKYSKLYEI